MNKYKKKTTHVDMQHQINEEATREMINDQKMINRSLLSHMEKLLVALVHRLS
jgi:hypothetical protein